MIIAACGNESNTVSGKDKDSIGGDTVDRAMLNPPSDSGANMTTTKDTTNADSKASPDASLVYQLVESMYGGIAVMKDGATKATNPSVKSLAQKLEITHTKLTNELKALAAKKNWKLPAGESAADMSTRADMAKMAPAEYEKAWLVALADRHQTNVAKIEAAHPVDADLKAARTKGLPVLKGLLTDIRKVEAQMK